MLKSRAGKRPATPRQPAHRAERRRARAWLDANQKACTIEDPSLARATQYLNFKLFRYGDTHEVAIQLIDVETGIIKSQKMGRGGHGEDGLVEAINSAWDQLDVSIGQPVAPCSPEEINAATCTFEAEVSGAIADRFEGEAFVGFDSESSTAQAEDLHLAGEGFDLKTGLTPALDVGEIATLSGTFAVAGRSSQQEGAFEIFGMQKEYGDFVTVAIQESRTIGWLDLPKALRDYTASFFSGEASSDAAPFEGMSDDQHQAHYEEQVGDVVHQGILEGQLTQNSGKLLEAVGKKPGQITFRAEFDAGDETFGCDYEGFPAKMEQQWEELRQQVKQIKEQQGGGR